MDLAHCHDVAWRVTYRGRACKCGIPFVWIPVLKGGAAMLAAPDNLRCGRGTGPYALVPPSLL